MTEDYWNTRDVASDIVVLGDGEGQVDTVGGLLIDIVESDIFDGAVHYLIVNKAGDTLRVAGCASLNSQVTDADLGEFVKFTFVGWAMSKANRKFKAVEVQVWNGPPDKLPKALKAWPMADKWRTIERVSSLSRTKAAGPQTLPPTGRGLDELPAALDDDDDDLPF